MTTVPPPPPPPPPAYAPGPASPEPGEVGSIRAFFIVSLIVHSLATVAWLASTIGFGLATCGIGCLLVVIPCFTGAAVVLDAMVLGKLNRREPGTASFIQVAAIVDIIGGLIGLSAIPLVMGILSLVYLQKPDVQRYLTGGGN